MLRKSCPDRGKSTGFKYFKYLPQIFIWNTISAFFKILNEKEHLRTNKEILKEGEDIYTSYKK